MQIIAHQELASAQASITFSSIPQTYTDLYLVVSERNASSNDVGLFAAFNGSTSNYSIRRLIGTGSSALSQNFAERLIGASANANYTASTFSNNAIYIPNYTSSNYKSWSADSVTENNATGSYQQIIAGLWSDNSAITSIVITPNGGSLAQYSSATLYGITKGSDGIVTVS
jgi:hypothetical protein